MPTPAELLAQSLSAYRNANRIDGTKNSYRKDNPAEYVAVMLYLDGGSRPTGVLSLMGEGLVLEEDARRALQGTPPPPPPPPPTGVAIPTRSVSMPAGGLAHWNHYNSPTTQIVGTDGNNFRQRVVNWDTAGGKSPALYSGKTTYCLIGYRLITGYPGRLLDWHNMSDDQPYGWLPLINQGGAGTYVSPVAIDHWGNANGVHMIIQPEKDVTFPTNYYFIFTHAEAEARRGSWVWFWMRLDWGRSDYPSDGRARLWVAGEDDSPRIDAQNINTHWWGQHMISCFQGCYWSSKNGPAITIEHAAMRFGRTPQECYLDVPVYHADSTYSPPGSSTAIAPRSSTEAAIPADLAW